VREVNMPTNFNRKLCIKVDADGQMVCDTAGLIHLPHESGNGQFL